MKKNRYKSNRMLCILLIIILFVSLIQIGFLDAAAEATEPEFKEYKITKFEDKITILNNNFKVMNINFQEGNQLEIVFLLQVTDEMTIDIWFVNEDNYLLLSGGAQYLFYMDGSQQQVSYANKIVTLTEHDNYKLVMTNYYTNQTVEVDIAGELRTYGLESNEKSSENEELFMSLLLYPLLITIIIVVLIITVFIKIHRARQTNQNGSKNKSSKKSKNKKPKKNKQKKSNKTISKKPKTKKNKQPTPEITVTTTSKKQKKKAISISASNSFCGQCGQPISTPFCTGCGADAPTPIVTMN